MKNVFGTYKMTAPNYILALRIKSDDIVSPIPDRISLQDIDPCPPSVRGCFAENMANMGARGNLQGATTHPSLK